MIKVFQDFLNEGEPKVRDYVICKIRYGDYGYDNQKLQNFLKDNIGQIGYINHVGNQPERFNYSVTFNIIPPTKQSEVVQFRKSSIKHFSENKEDL